MFASELASGLGVLVVAVGVIVYEAVSFTLLARKHHRLLVRRAQLVEQLLNEELKGGMVLRSEQYRQAGDAVRAAQLGMHVVVTMAPQGYSLAEAQAHVDRILAPIYPTKKEST